MKKGLSLLLSFVMCVTWLVPAYAGQDEKSYFMKAWAVTATELERETAIVNRVDQSSALLSELFANFSYETLIGFSVQSEHGDFAMLDGLWSTISSKIDAKNQNNKTNIAFSLPKAMLNSKNDMAREITVFNSPDAIAFQFPEISDQYYQIRRDIDPDDWAASPIGNELPYDIESMVPMSLSVLGMTGQSTGLSMEMLDEAFLEKLAQPYLALLTRHMDRASYTDEGTTLLETNRGMLGVKKTTVRFTSEQLQAFVDDMGELVVNDQNLRAFIDSIYGSLGQAYGYNLTDLYMSELASMFDYIIVPDELCYSIYTNPDYKILRHELTVPDDYEGQYTVTVDTFGKPYLLDEIYITVAEEYDGSISSVNFTATGNFVPENGVFRTDMTMRAYEAEQTATGLQVLEATEIMKANYLLDMNKKTDNFEMNIHIGRFERDSYSQESPYDVNIEIKGDYDVNTDAKSVLCNFKNIHVQTGESLDYALDFSLSVLYRAIPAAEAGIPQDQIVNLIDLTEEEVTTLGEKLEKLWQP